MSSIDVDFARSCFVIMPFGRKPVGDAEVDFDLIYREVFEPAIRATPLAAPESGYLEPRRTDQDFFSGSIDLEMFRYLEYSRFALADISGLNANVLYELGVRHRADPAGTAIFRQAGTVIPFDIKAVKAFEYAYQPTDEVARSRVMVTRVLTESLRYNRPDSPVRIALDAQRARSERSDVGPGLDEVLRAAENALRAGRPVDAIARYREAVRLAPGNTSTRMKLGLLLKDTGRLDEALAEFRDVAGRRPDYAEALREQGIVENRLYQDAGRPQGLPSGEEALRRAVQLSPQDYDGLASLGGILKRQAIRLDEAGRDEGATAIYQVALGYYRKATLVSAGDAYPLLNELKIQGRLEGRMPLDALRTKTFLRKAQASRRAQAEMTPPMDLPWSAFDLAEIALYLGDTDGWRSWLERGLENCNTSFQPRTFRQSLELLRGGGVSLEGMDEGIAMLAEAETWFLG